MASSYSDLLGKKRRKNQRVGKLLSLLDSSGHTFATKHYKNENCYLKESEYHNKLSNYRKKILENHYLLQNGIPDFPLGLIIYYRYFGL